MRFSKAFSLERTKTTEWFDTFLLQDTPLYVDPMLVFRDKDPLWADARDRVVEFFATAAHFVELAKGDENSAHWKKATSILTFPEPKEFVLGVSMGSPDGAGTGPHFAKEMARALDLITTKAAGENIEFVELFVLFMEGIGVDRISDIFCNILKSHFVKYTQEFCEANEIPCEPVALRNAEWDAKTGRWIPRKVLLPKNPHYDMGVILVPERFLQSIENVSEVGFWGWAETTAANILRYDLNYDLSQELTVSTKRARAREIARQRPALAIKYVQHQAALKKPPYNVQRDSELRVGWPEAGQSIFSGQEPIEGPASEPEFNAWIGELAAKFQHAIENTSAVDLLWSDRGQPRAERIIQGVAQVLFTAHCQAANIDISKEVNVGRGPVDFKFSQGWKRRALIEVKLIKSSHFSQGAAKQLPQYLKGEQISCGYYLCVGFTDADFAEARLNPVRETLKALSEKSGAQITPIFVDARKKPSASKL